MSQPRELVMSIDLNALEHLGINLYSNIPAVLSEIVANAWDADAQNVTVTVDKAKETITIEDGGTGMDRNGVIDRFLRVGFKRREALGEDTPGGRKPMGRKGIGKLSIFSIAQIAEVYTIQGRERTAFKMDRDVIRKAISGNTDYPIRPIQIAFRHDGGRPETACCAAIRSDWLETQLHCYREWRCDRTRGPRISQCNTVSVDLWRATRFREIVQAS